MGFRCGHCRIHVGPGVAEQKVVIKSRRKEYPYRQEVNLIRVIGEDGKKHDEYRDDPGGVGYETVREVALCNKCANKFADTMRSEYNLSQLVRV